MWWLELFNLNIDIIAADQFRINIKIKTAVWAQSPHTAVFIPIHSDAVRAAGLLSPIFGERSTNFPFLTDRSMHHIEIKKAAGNPHKIPDGIKSCRRVPYPSQTQSVGSHLNKSKSYSKAKKWRIRDSPECAVVTSQESELVKRAALRDQASVLQSPGRRRCSRPADR